MELGTRPVSKPVKRFNLSGELHSIQTFIRPSRLSFFPSIDFLPLQRSHYLQEIWNMCNKQIGFATLYMLKSLPTLIFKNKCMIRFADPPPNQGGVRIYQMARKTTSFVTTTRRRRTVFSKQGLSQRQLWLKRKKTTTIRLTLTDCFTQPTQNHHHHRRPGYSDVWSLPETDRESIHRRNTPRDRKPCCAVGATF